MVNQELKSPESAMIYVLFLCWGGVTLGCYQFPADVKDPCEDKECHFGAQCRPSMDGRTAECVCPEKCATYGDSRGSRPVCGTDGRDYPNECELRRTSCKEMREILIKFKGHCDPCEGVECPTSQVCQLDDSRNPICRCNAICSQDLRPVCGSDGKTYTNECTLRVESCKSRKNIRIIYVGECSSGANPCENLKCGPGEECDIDRYGIATCQCPPTCEPVMRPVCGSDGQTYHNECELKRQGCLLKKEITLAYRGECGERGPCHKHSCSFGAMCVVKGGYAVCECPTCTEEFEPVCGSDGISYTNLCKLKQEGCDQKMEISVAYTGLCNGCEHKRCEFYAACESDGKNEARCVCPHSCVKVESSVCGTDGQTYLNECEMRVAACNKQQYVVVGSRGPCDLCQGVHCKYGARCENGRCVCPTDCPNNYEPACATDGTTYHNECEMRRAACVQSQEFNVLFYGECEDVGSSGQDFGSGSKGCQEKVCKYGSVCEYDADGMPQCVCNFNCPMVREPVCGSDNVIYPNDCRLKEESCRQQIQVYIIPMSMCEDSKDEPCDGEMALIDPLTGKDYDCGDNEFSKPCPPSSYCHKTTKFAKCCREVALIKTCADTTYGCCPDEKTAALGPNHAGCPSVCNCNRLGSYGLTCDAETMQCSCKPGVGGLRCDRCEPGYWGLHKATEGNSGCSSCGCNQHGSVRDDCEQMTGRCVCKQGIKGMKCDTCPSGTVLGPEGCMDVSLSKAVTGSCVDLVCLHGATCKEKDGQAQCICEFRCSPEDNRDSVCGSDGNTYGSECQLRLFSCRYQKAISVYSNGPCKRGSQVSQLTPTPGPVRRSTVQRLSAAADHSETKSTRDITLSKPENYQLTTRPTLATPVAAEHSIETPSFFGRSYLELPKLQAYTRLSLELEFRTFSKDGIILYNGQTDNGSGDFISLAVKDGFVEFRYNLGNGPVVLRSPQKLHLGRFHRLIAKRYLREGMLTLDGLGDVAGRSQGSLKSLDLGENLFLGYVPTEQKGIFDNIAVNTGMIGCIRKLKIGRKEIDLRFPRSKDILGGSNIHECGNGPCNHMPCKNGAICEPLGENDHSCSCLPGFTGKSCETPQDPCAVNPCLKGSTCVTEPGQGFVCRCPPGKNGKFCEKDTRDVDELFIPDFNGQSYLEFTTLTNVRQSFSIEVWFLTRSPEGTLLYNGQHASGKGDFIAITLAGGYVRFCYDLGSGVPSISGVVTIRSLEPVTLHSWHSVKVNRLWKNGTLQVDDGEIVAGESLGTLTELNLEQHLFVGGVPNFEVINPDSGVVTGLNGAIQRITVNGDIWNNLMALAIWSHAIHRYRGLPCSEAVCLHGGICIPQLNQYLCRCTLNHWGQKCEKTIEKEDLDRPIAFESNTFLSFSNKPSSQAEGQRENNIEVTFRSVHPQGLLLWINKGATIRGDYMALAITEGHAQLSFNLGKQMEPLLITSKERVDDGGWHTLVVERNLRLGSLAVDDNPPVSNMSEPGATELNTDGIYWIGGSPSLPSGLPASYYHGFRGCIDAVVIDGEPLHLVMHGTGDVTFCDPF